MIKKGVKVKIISGKDKNKDGDKVSIIECKPYSKTKKFEVLGENKWYKFKQNY